MADGDPDTVGTDSPLADLETVRDMALAYTSDDETRTLAGQTLPCSLLLCSVGSHTLSETTLCAHADAADLLQPERVHDVTDGCLCARQSGDGGILGESLGGDGGVVG